MIRIMIIMISSEDRRTMQMVPLGTTGMNLLRFSHCHSWEERTTNGLAFLDPQIHRIFRGKVILHRIPPSTKAHQDVGELKDEPV